jgi:hypothetical protein
VTAAFPLQSRVSNKAGVGERRGRQAGGQAHHQKRREATPKRREGSLAKGGERVGRWVPRVRYVQRSRSIQEAQADGYRDERFERVALS